MEDLLNRAPCGYLSYTDDGIVRRCNATLEKMLHYEEGELIDKKLESILTTAGRIFFQTHLFPLLKLQANADEIFLTIISKDHVLIPVLTNTVRIEEEGMLINNCILLPVQQRRKFEDEILEAKKKAEEALKDNKELIKARLEIESHNRAIDKQLNRLNQFNSDLLQFNKIITHDMQECIRKIILFTQIMNEKTPDSRMDKVLISAKRLKSINSNLELFISLGLIDGERSTVHLKEAVESCVQRILQETKFQNLKIIMSDLPTIQASEYQIKILFRELFTNAIKFRKGDDVLITIDHVVFESNLYKNSKDKYVYGEVIKITFQDDGAGFDKYYIKDAFKILKKPNSNTESGLGFGLAICRKVVHNHHGDITVASEQNLGTLFSITLPLNEL